MSDDGLIPNHNIFYLFLVSWTTGNIEWLFGFSATVVRKDCKPLVRFDILCAFIRFDLFIEHQL